MNSGPSYLRFAEQEGLPRLMPIFWIGFNLGLVPATLLVKRFGASAMMVVAGVMGVCALTACARAPSLDVLMVAQAFSGIAWCFALVSAFSIALEVGSPGREGLLTGILFSTLAAAALLRLGLVVSNVQVGSGPAHLENLPFIAWALASFLMAMVAFPERARRPSPPG
jgi:MFS family permease